MTEMLNKTMLDSWRKYWGTNDDDIPDPPPASRPMNEPRRPQAFTGSAELVCYALENHI